MNRREFVLGLFFAGGGVVGTYGGYEFGYSDGKDVGYEQGYDQASSSFRRPTRSGREIISKEINTTVEVGSHAKIQIEPDEETMLFFQAYSDSLVDFLALNPDDYARYRSDKDSGYYELLSNLNTTETFTRDFIGLRNLVFVADNTTRGEAVPTQNTDVTMRVTGFGKRKIGD